MCTLKVILIVHKNKIKTLHTSGRPKPYTPVEDNSNKEIGLGFKGIDVRADHFTHSIMILQGTTATMYFVQYNI